MSKDSDKGTASVQWARCWGRDACVVKRPSRYAVYGKMKNCCDLHRFYFESKCLTRNLWFPSEKRKKGISRESLALKNDETTPIFNASCFVFFLLIVLKHFFYHSYSGSVCELWIYAVSPWFYLRMFLLPAEWGGKQSLPSFYTHDPSTACCNVNWGGHCSLPSVSHRKCSWGHGCRLLMAHSFHSRSASLAILGSHLEAAKHELEIGTYGPRLRSGQSHSGASWCVAATQITWTYLFGCALSPQSSRYAATPPGLQWIRK